MIGLAADGRSKQRPYIRRCARRSAIGRQRKTLTRTLPGTLSRQVASDRTAIARDQQHRKAIRVYA
jgi:hypothetical protein